MDTLCEIFLNGTSILKAENMHRVYEVDIKNTLTEGENTLHAVFKSPVEYVLKMQHERPLINSGDAISGISHLRKAHYMFGWDWGPKLPDLGIWRNISIHVYDMGRIDDVYITQRHEETNVELDVRVRLKKMAFSEQEILVQVKTPEGKTVEHKIIATTAEEHISIIIQNPELW